MGRLPGMGTNYIDEAVLATMLGQSEEGFEWGWVDPQTRELTPAGISALYTSAGKCREPLIFR